MKIRDLIQELSAFNLEAEITTPYSETIRLSWIDNDDNNDIKSSKKTTKIVFIEGCDFIEEDEDRIL